MLSTPSAFMAPVTRFTTRWDAAGSPGASFGSTLTPTDGSSGGIGTDVPTSIAHLKQGG